MSKKTPKKQRWSENLPTPKYDDGLLIGAGLNLALAISADEDAYDKNVLADAAAGEIRAYRKSLNVDSERKEIPCWVDEWQTTGNPLLWVALRLLTDVVEMAHLAELFANDGGVEEKVVEFTRTEAADCARLVEACLREHWKQRPENRGTGAPTSTVCCGEDGCE